jgi:branched-chain amino acid transport system ATP-binding protein
MCRGPPPVEVGKEEMNGPIFHATPTAAPGDGGTPAPPVLVVESLSVTYSNGAQGIAGMSLSVSPGQVVAILGRNGAGKTSTLRGIAGIPYSERARITGTVRVNGNAVGGRTPNKAHRAGVTLVLERDKVFPNLTVEEHLRLVSGTAGARGDCAFAPIEGLRRRRAGLLSGGQRQMLAIEMALRQQPRVLLIDEMSLGLAPVIIEELMTRVRRIATDLQTAVVIVEQEVVNALAISDYVHVVDRGEPVLDGPAAQMDAEELGRRLLGRSL